MFPSRLQRIATGLAELADAMLGPEHECADAPADHPHRRPARVAPVRRGGTIAARPQECVSPVPSRSAATPSATPSHR